MKNLLVLTSLAFLTVSTSSIAKNIYGDVQVTDIEPANNFIWERANKNTPKYPIELARSGIRGCAVLSLNISDSGKTENVEIINSLPSKHLGKYSRKMLKKWKWVPVLTGSDISPEKRTLRLDFCMGGESTEQSQKACIQQTQLACG
ncbi:energy transducer TonB [Colwellia sp. MB3u-70]|uniref:energy transducer TonB n=1 Tax=unclassified Colwellia TaxID=196834 RepID=UPI0015F43ADF|nr:MULTISPECIES: energy transducer TonB [unclassified Colwellia]MBA6293790.1 energy transducer TonB [Colwellia sp. MB3u-8]MBA6306738.1 energy transducer TonB [Colwellia sp. MB3u-70]